MAGAHCAVRASSQQTVLCLSVSGTLWTLQGEHVYLLDLQVTHKHIGPHPGSADCSDDLDGLVPAWQPASSPSKSALRQRPSWHHGRRATDAPFTQRCSVSHNAGLSPQRPRQRQGSQYQPYASMDMLCRDMQQLDAQIADLDVNLASASHRVHR